MARIYLPAVHVNDVIAMAAKMHTSHRLDRLDDHTMRCRVSGITYIPIPPSAGVNYTGLLALDVPATVRKGQIFNVVVRQLTNAFGESPPPPPGLAPHRSAASSMTMAPEPQEIAFLFRLKIGVEAKDQNRNRIKNES